MTCISDDMGIKESIELVKGIRVAICGSLPSACKALRDAGVVQIDKYDDAVSVGLKLRQGEEYHLILVYAPQGEGLDAEMPYKVKLKGEWKTVPVKLLNEPACESALIELQSTVRCIAKKQSEDSAG